MESIIRHTYTRELLLQIYYNGNETSFESATMDFKRLLLKKICNIFILHHHLLFFVVKSSKPSNSYMLYICNIYIYVGNFCIFWRIVL
jgi:hypothetical protein